MSIEKSSLRNRQSRYVQGGKTESRKTVVGWWERKIITDEKADDDIVIESLPIEYESKPSLLSFDYYDDNNLEWIILQYNNIIDVNEEFVTGSTIRLPSLRKIKAIMRNHINYESDDV